MCTEGMLEDGQLIGVVADVVEQSLGEAVADFAAADCNGAFDGLPALIAVEPRDEVFALVNSLGESTKLGAVSEKSERMVSTT